MAEPIDQKEPGAASGGSGGGGGEDGIPYVFDAGSLSGRHPPDSPFTSHEDDEEFASSSSSNSRKFSSAGKSKWLAELVAGVHLFSQAMLQTELSQMEMIKARESLWLEAEKRRIESEAEMTRMLLQTQLHQASLASAKRRSRKRKQIGEDDSTSRRQEHMLFSLLLCNWII